MNRLHRNNFSNVNKDKNLNSLLTTKRNKTPRIKSLAQLGGVTGNAGQLGEIILNRSDRKFYGHNGRKWVPLGGGGGGASVPGLWALNGNNYVQNTAVAGVDFGTNNFIFGAAGTESSDAGANKTRMFFITSGLSNGSFRAGFVSDTQWDSPNRGAFSCAVCSNNIAKGLASFVAGNKNNCIGNFSSIVAGSTNIVNDTVENSAILSGSSLTLDQSNTAMTQNFRTTGGVQHQGITYTSIIAPSRYNATNLDHHIFTTAESNTVIITLPGNSFNTSLPVDGQVIVVTRTNTMHTVSIEATSVGGTGLEIVCDGTVSNVQPIPTINSDCSVRLIYSATLNNWFRLY